MPKETGEGNKDHKEVIMLENIKAGDRVINSLGEEATVIRSINYENGRIRLYTDPPITGWLGSTGCNSWSYETDGEFVRDSRDQKASDIVKVIKCD